jgi:DNA invertase Pin-like site-specific DNA recombinase
MNGRFVSYLRVSTDKQGRSGLDLEAQREAVATYLDGGSWQLVAEFIEVESGKNNERPKLAAALAHCKLTGATLVVAKLDRLSRDQSFLMSVWSGTGDGGVVFCDLPSIPAGPVGKFIVQQMAAVAELERGLTSARTKAALQAAKARGVKLGGFKGYVPDGKAGADGNVRAATAFAERVGPVVTEMRAAGMTLARIAAEMAARGIKTARGGAWTATAVRNVLARAAGASPS